jgi:hypothetical protein
MALSGHRQLRRICPLLGVKRTYRFAAQMSACDPKPTSRGGARIVFADIPVAPPQCECFALPKAGDAATIAGYCGKSDALDEAIGKFAMSYAKQTEQDYEALVKAKRAGRVKVATEASH